MWALGDHVHGTPTIAEIRLVPGVIDVMACHVAAVVAAPPE